MEKFVSQVKKAAWETGDPDCNAQAVMQWTFPGIAFTLARGVDESGFAAVNSYGAGS